MSSRPAGDTLLMTASPRRLARLNWQRDSAAWPNRQYSRFIHAGGIRWHVQRGGDGPPLLLVHGTGASTHSWAGLLPLLMRHFTVLAPDLPGHGFTATPGARGLTLDGMATALTALLDRCGLACPPRWVVGHSAGAAILARMCLDRRLQRCLEPRGLFAINGAFLGFSGLAGSVFSPLAKLLAINPLVPRLLSWRADDPDAVARMIRSTGSELDDTALEGYRRLFTSRAHVAATLAMMAGWRLDELRQHLPALQTPLVLLVGAQDRAIPPADADRVKALVPSARICCLKGLGHLAHEEAPRRVAATILRHRRRLGQAEVV